MSAQQGRGWTMERLLAIRNFFRRWFCRQKDPVTCDPAGRQQAVMDAINQVVLSVLPITFLSNNRTIPLESEDYEEPKSPYINTFCENPQTKRKCWKLVSSVSFVMCFIAQQALQTTSYCKQGQWAGSNAIIVCSKSKIKLC